MTFPGPWPPPPGPTSQQGSWAPNYGAQPPPYPAGGPGPQGWWQQPTQQPPNAVPPYGWQPPPPPKRSRLNWVVAALIPALGAVIALGVWGFYHHQHEQQLAQIRDTITEFAEASDTADAARLSSLMCQQEAAQFQDGYEGIDDDGRIEPAERRPVTIGAITVTDDNATVDVSRPPTPTVTFKLKREEGRWKLCNPS
jgi:hypothetical protein